MDTQLGVRFVSRTLSSRADAMRAEQFRQLFRNAPIGVLAALVAGVVLYWLLIHFTGVSRPAMNIWIAVMFVQSLGRIALCEIYRRASPPVSAWHSWAIIFSLGTLTGGITWGVGSLLMASSAQFDLQLLVIMTISALVYGALSSFGSYLPAFYAFFLPALVPLTVWSALQHDIEHDAYAVLSAIWIPVVAWLAHVYNKNAIESLNLRYENLDLLENLREQKEMAEQANIAKSRFLASASHDLRQPVHALGMFVGALRAHEMSAQAVRLLDHIEGSVTALDGLFKSLLDISRLDAGVVQAYPRVFAIQPLLERIWRDFEGEATQKGLALRLLPCSAAVRSDPILLERILRNIVSNAVRYTEHGRIVIGCRRGAQLSVEVWDTGVGIPDNHREQVFEEFYQVANPGRDRSQGLGLGLAIVRRLTRILDHPLTFVSAVGRGSVFKIAVPYASTVELPAKVSGSAAYLGKGLILVVDDEVAIQEAMRSLLESWGHTVIVASSGDEMLLRVSDCPDRPELIICDYRLDNEGGIGVIQRLQSEFNDEIPAMLVTGDTAPDRLIEARESGFVLLHKPVSAHHLREAIGATLRREPAAS
ncbi:MAG: response regulator [Alphaproteobacteria bacterium]|nr:response regulator [Alphaproteobacteria bacterium]